MWSMNPGTRRTGSATFLHEDVLEAALRRLRAGQDVVLVGDVGAGRTVILDELAERLRAAGTSVVPIAGLASARGLPYAAFAPHPMLRPRAGARPSMPEAVAALTSVLGTGRAVIVLDDAHLLDDASVAAIDAVRHQRSLSVRLVLGARAGVDLAGTLPDLARGADLLQVEPLDVSAVATLVAEHLGGAVEGDLAAVLAGRAGGNPRVAVALATAARDAEAITRRRGRWAQREAIELVRTDAVVRALLADVPDDQRDALDVLAWLGLVELGAARLLVGSATLAALDARGRVAVHVSGRDQLVAVSPPALGQALRLRMPATVRAAVHDLAHQVLGSVRRGPEQARLPESADQGTQASYQLAQQQVAILTESVRTQATQRYRAWDRRRDLAAALPVLRLRLLDGLASIDVDEVFTQTSATPEDSPDDLGEYVLLRAQWAASCGRPVREAFSRDPGPSGALVLPDVGEPFLSLLERLYETRGWPADELSALDDDRDVPAPLRDLVLLWRGQVAIEDGSPDRALDLLGGWQPSASRQSFAHELGALRTDALLLAGQVDDAVAWARERLSAASDELSMFGVRLATRGLATALVVAGDHDGALRALGVVLSMGRTGPVHSPYDDRILGLAAMLHAQRGEHDLADALLDELRSTPRPYPPALDVLDPWARVEVAYFRTGVAAASGGSALWEAGERFRTGGRLTSALLCWAFAPLVLDDERLAHLEELQAATTVAATGPLVALHRAIAHGTSTQVLQAVAAVRVPGPLVQLAVEAAERGGALDGQDLAATGGPLAVAAVRRDRARRAPLTAREVEVVSLARSGLTNRQIASRLYLSVRTVENHLYRAMQKLAVTDRARLADIPDEVLGSP